MLLLSKETILLSIRMIALRIAIGAVRVLLQCTSVLLLLMVIHLKARVGGVARDLFLQKAQRPRDETTSATYNVPQRRAVRGSVPAKAAMQRGVVTIIGAGLLPWQQ